MTLPALVSDPWLPGIFNHLNAILEPSPLLEKSDGPKTVNSFIIIKIEGSITKKFFEN